MIAVIFELTPKPEAREQYFEIATDLRPLLDDIDGFISIERFQSLSEPDKFLSLSFWRDETAVRAWRTLQKHRAAQRIGRAEVFENYRLRVATVQRDYGMEEREQTPEDSRDAHEAGY
ncbi:MAG: antibiotic biosynthesis monooxygenase [Paracoccaceae bacterium]